MDGPAVKGVSWQTPLVKTTTPSDFEPHTSLHTSCQPRQSSEPHHGHLGYTTRPKGRSKGERPGSSP